MARRVLASHFVIDLERCDRKRMDSPSVVREALARLCRDARLNVVRRVQHEFTPHGLTILFVLKESHLAYSSWPERGYAVLDLFLCGETAGLMDAVARFAEDVGARVFRRRQFPVGPRISRAR